MLLNISAKKLKSINLVCKIHCDIKYNIICIIHNICKQRIGFFRDIVFMLHQRYLSIYVISKYVILFLVEINKILYIYIYIIDTMWLLVILENLILLLSFHGKDFIFYESRNVFIVIQILTDPSQDYPQKTAEINN